jgi:hypothetical protein
MNSIISDIINSFETKSKTSTAKYKDFITHVYKTFDDKIKTCKTEKIKNKYKKMRFGVLEYIMANEKVITSKICKHK